MAFKEKVLEEFSDATSNWDELEKALGFDLRGHSISSNEEEFSRNKEVTPITS